MSLNKGAMIFNIIQLKSCKKVVFFWMNQGFSWFPHVIYNNTNNSTKNIYIEVYVYINLEKNFSIKQHFY